MAKTDFNQASDCVQASTVFGIYGNRKTDDKAMEHKMDQIVVVGAEHSDPPPDCFKLNPDCWE